MINSDAASWHVGVSAIANDGTELDHNSLAWAKVQRFSKLTVMPPGAGEEGQDPHRHRKQPFTCAGLILRAN
ncbi:hypothetical protein SMICM17S_05903 [Streptomyces microflavus]